MEYRCELSGLSEIEVVEAVVFEGISRDTCAQVRVVATEAEGAFDDVGSIGQPVVLKILVDDEVVRAFHLVVREIEDEGLESDHRTWTLRLVDRFNLLDLRTDVRIFQEKSTQEIVTQVYQDAGIDPGTVTWNVTRSLPKRVYCVQCRERDSDFTSRLLAHEGVFRIPADEVDGAKSIFADEAAAFVAIDGEPSVTLVDHSNLGSGIDDFEVEYCIVSDEIVLKDWNYETPMIDLMATGSLSGTVQSQLYEFPGGFSTPAEGKALSTIRSEELMAQRSIARGRAHQTSFRPGRWFELSGTRRDPLDTKWLLREVTHRYALRGIEGQAAYEVRFVASFLEQAYRPRRDVKRPIVAGSHSIKVTGPSGEEIHTESLGRMKGRFFWDRVGKEDDKASCWMRVVQLPIGGSQALARVGWEMIVRYAFGDPDRPIAIARADNGTHPAPYAYPKAASAMSFKTLSSPGGAKFNEFTMEDGGGGMKFGVTASKDWNEQVNNDKTEKIGVDEKLDVGTDLSTNIGASQTETVGGSHTMTVGADSGVEVGGSRTKSVGGSETLSISGNLAEKVASADTESVGGSHTSIAALGVNRTSSGSHSLTVGGTMLSLAGLGCAVAVAGAKSETVGAAKLVLAGGAISETAIGAVALTVGGAYIHRASGNRTSSAKGSSSLLVGGVALLNAGGQIQIKAPTIKITVGGVVNLLGGGGILNLTPGSATCLGLFTADGSGSVKLAGAPNLTT